MNTSDILDLFQLGGERGASDSTSAEKAKQGRPEGLKSILENLPELWSDDQYRSEYDLSNFMHSLGSSGAQ